MPVTQPVESRTSPFGDLNDRFKKQNEDLESLLVRLTDRLHGLSNTNYPSPEDQSKKESPVTPFGDGHLMSYYYQLNGNNSLINTLRGLVEKVEILV